MNPLLDRAAKLVIAHRGNSAFAPENTLDSLKQGIALGADAIEFDVRLTRDGQAVLIHDATLERTTNGIGSVHSHSLAELQQLDAGCRFTCDDGRTFPYRSRGIRIPTLESVLAAFPEIPFILEIKTAEASGEVKRLLEIARASSRCLLGAFDDAALEPFRRTAFARSASQREMIRLFARAALPGGPREAPYQALAIPPKFKFLPLPVLRFARMARDAGIATHVWTVDEPAQARHYWGGGVNGIITNDPAAVRTSIAREPIATPQPSLLPAS